MFERLAPLNGFSAAVRPHGVTVVAFATAFFVSFCTIPTHSAFAEQKSAERIGCDNGRKRCESRCDATMIDVGWQIAACKRDCQVEWVKCLPIGETPEGSQLGNRVRPGLLETAPELSPAPSGPVLQSAPDGGG